MSTEATSQPNQSEPEGEVLDEAVLSRQHAAASSDRGQYGAGDPRTLFQEDSAGRGLRQDECKCLSRDAPADVKVDMPGVHHRHDLLTGMS